MIFPPFQAPKLESINEAAKLVGAELESILYLPKYNRKTMNPVTWGKLYILKLEHISSIKQNVRTVGRSLATSMPAKAGHGKNAIRIGEQDSWSYLAYEHGKDVLREMFLVNGDNPKIKNDIIRKIETDGSWLPEKERQKPNDYIEDMTSGSAAAFKNYCTVAGLSIR